MAIISMLTDFGLTDEYVGVMKGVIAAINPDAKVVDISHQVPAQDIFRAAVVLKAAYGYFPAGTVHMAVVDPGVGSGRRIVAAKAGDYFFLGPDNGILWPALQDAAGENLKAIKVENTEFFLDRISPTFHGRDIFAPVAAHLSRGVNLERLGPVIGRDELVPLAGCSGTIEIKDGILRGYVVGSDHFGNLLTDIHRRHLLALGPEKRWQEFEISIGCRRLKGLHSTYSQAAKGMLLALIGSRNTLEIAVNQGRAVDAVGVARGEPVVVAWTAAD